MFDFMDEDWFVITLEVVFLVLIIYDVRQYILTKKKEYMINILLTFGFAVWTLYPMYIKYFNWKETQRVVIIKGCNKEDNVTLCNCVNDSLFKEYSYNEVESLSAKKLQEFKKEAKEECLDDSWF